jgi:hypothetical protein
MLVLFSFLGKESCCISSLNTSTSSSIIPLAMIRITGIPQTAKLPLILLVTFFIIVFWFNGVVPSPEQATTHRIATGDLSSHLSPSLPSTSSSTQTLLSSNATTDLAKPPISKPGPTHNYAFSLFLAAPSMKVETDADDLYFVGTRMLIYQLLYDPETRTNNSYPIVVLITEDVCKFRNCSPRP